MTQEINSQTGGSFPEMNTSKIVDIFQQSYDEDHEPIGSQHLTFSLGEEFYAVDILCVQEIRAWESVTRIPNTPDYIKGVINLRGSILPVIDMRQYFLLEDIQYLDTTVVIVIAIDMGEREIQVGIVVDMVSDVIRFTEEEINEPPKYGDDVKGDFIKGLITASISENVVNFMETLDHSDDKEETGNNQTVSQQLDISARASTTSASTKSTSRKKEKSNSDEDSGNSNVNKMNRVEARDCMVMLLDTTSIGSLIIDKEIFDELETA